MSYRQPILDAALALFAERGYSSTSVSEVSLVTGAAEGTIFHHFKTKDGVFLAVLEQVRQTLCAEVARAREEGSFESGLEALEAIITLFFTLSESRRPEFLLLFLGYTHRLAGVNPACRDHLEAIYEAFADALTEAITMGIDDGSIRPVPAEQHAMLILAMLSGVVRFRAFDLWPSARSYPDALEFCRSALATGGPR